MQYIVTTPWWLRMLFPKNLIWEMPTKEKIIYPLAKHESYLNEYREDWREDVECFLKHP